MTQRCSRYCPALGLLGQFPRFHQFRIEFVVSGSAKHLIDTIFAGDRVVAGLTAEVVPPIAAEDLVGSVAAVDDVAHRQRRK